MSFIPLVSIFFVGLIVGSFLNVCILRGEKRESVRGRSRCPSCKKTLSFVELIPVVSFLLQKGRCRTCGAVLSLQYPLVELGTAFLYAGVFFFARDTFVFSFPSLLFFFALFAGIAASIVICVTDIRFTIIPDGALFVLLISALIFLFLVPRNITTTVASAAIFSSFLFSLWFFSRGVWIGFGDVKLVFVTSLLVGYPASFSAFLFSFWLGGIIGVLFLLLGKKSLKSALPFGPFIILGTFIAYFFSDIFFHTTGLGIFLSL